jgi:uncharacterized lipoprotein NlpE involved in copper resistance
MFRNLRSWLNRHFSKPSRVPARKSRRLKFRLVLEELESRIVPSLAAAVPYTIGTTTDGFVPNAADANVAAGNFTGNGITDLVVAHTSDDSLYFLRGNGNGTFQPAVKFATFTKPIDGDVFVGDFNGDGKLDLFVPSIVLSPPSSYPIILLGNGDGTFQAPMNSSQSFFPSSLNGTGSYVRGWAIADINGDGKQDLVANVVAEGVTAMLGNGDGTFQAPIFTPVTMGYSRWVAAGDFNGDGKADLAIGDGNGTNNQTGNSELTILLSNGDGTFRLGHQYAAPATPDGGGDGMGGGDVVNPEDVMVADLNNDGKLDVVESLYDHSIDVFLGNGDGSFQSAVGYTTGEYPRAVVAVDLTGNGIMDLVVDNVGVGPGGAAATGEGLETGSIAVLMGNGDGTFNPTPIQYTSTYFPGWVAVGDFNGDGLPDLATTLVSKGNEVDVTLNQSATGAPTLTTPASGVGFLADEPGTVYTNSVPLTTINLSVLGTDPSPDASPTYAWSLISKPSGAANPTFSINNNTTAGNTTATFSQAGLYDFEATITDPTSGESITSSVQVLIVLNQAPTVGTAASASPSPVAGTTTTLSVLGADDSGFLNLTYTWATTGTPPASVSFGPNSFLYNNVGVGVATNVTTATFSKAGIYSLQVTMTDPEGRSTTSSVSVTVNQTLTSILVTPAATMVADGGTQQFSAVALDQFANPMANQPTFTWSSTGPGSVNSSGLYSAPASGTGSASVKAKSSSVSGTASITVTAGQPPVVTTPASATPNPVTGSSTNLSVAATDPQGQALTYTWATTGTPPAPVSFGSGNGTVAGNNTTATFAKAGTYNFQVTVTDASGLSTTSDVTVAVNQTLTSIVVTPANITVNINGTQQFSATGLDQFGVALAVQPTFAWTVSGGGTINATGLFTAGATAGGPFDVAAGSSGVSGTTSATVSFLSVPAITAISPSIGPVSGGTVIVLTGTNFGGATAVTFGGVAASSFTVNSATQITVTTPAESVGTVDITVTTAGGTSATGAADQFTYQAANLDTWTGLGATNSWSEAANWSKDAAPGSGDTVIFDGHSGKNAGVDAGFAGTVAAV